MSIVEFLTSLPDFIGDAVATNQWIGYASILLAMFLENLFPPIPSELIMPLGGFYVSQGQLNFLPVVIAGLIGTVLGAFPWYGIGRLVSEKKLENWLKKYGKWIGISPRELYKSRDWFGRYGKALVFWGRLVPGIRTLISVPAGIELMPLLPFVIWTTAGSLIWVLFLTSMGIFLGESYPLVEVWIEPFSKIIKLILVFGLISGILWLFIRLFSSKK
ncbi:MULTISPECIES: DedA family protein [unclassified Prochlorococcus]|uniref:DedA family protein n=1 Tax=unclassified Prochlorococcus TaxID=2627481 RepID=UPI000533B7BE|nr:MULTISPECIES: DedA family protein [unclassified Prochlorococcus]KGG14601.1 DedA family [Prochlorococcus sp. MIT 0602]KGG15972.1 DedA family [Prochlorococcus sp. MIT 0603]